VGGGGAGLNPTHYLRQNTLQILQHIHVAEPQHSQAFPLKIVRPQPILFQTDITVVLATVELDHQPQLRTVEIQNIGRERMLPPKLVTGQLSVAQTAPEQAFAVGQVVS